MADSLLSVGLRPMVIDESLPHIESLMLVRELGYSGAAFKACKAEMAQ